MPPSPTSRETGVRSAGASRSATATESRSTAEEPAVRPAGVLFLTAGGGTRAEPLSFLRPKALLPLGPSTVLGTLSKSFSALEPGRVLANASRCPDLVRGEIERSTSRECGLLFESRPLGVCRTLSGLDGRIEGTWFVANTDMVVGTDLGGMLAFHRAAGNDWTVLAGPPVEGYHPLMVSESGSFTGGVRSMHYWGISIIEPGIVSLAASRPWSGLFDGLAAAASDAGMRLGVFEAAGGDTWMDTGEVESYRKAVLSMGSYIHPGARIEAGTVLEGSWHIGDGCLATSGSIISCSVMLDGSRLEGARLSSTVLPWFETRTRA